MTVDWLLQILSGTNTNNNNNYNNNNFNGGGSSNNFNNVNNNNNNRDQIPAEATKGVGPSSVHPILSGGIPASPDVDPFFRDAFQSDLKLPSFEPGYPAFFILTLLVSLTTLSFFVLLFLCCIHPHTPASKSPPPSSSTPASTAQTDADIPDLEDDYEEDVEEIYIPGFIDAATSPFPEMIFEEELPESDDAIVIDAEEPPPIEEDDVVVIEAEDPAQAEADDTVVIEAEDPPPADADDTIVIEAEEPPPTESGDVVVIETEDPVIIQANDTVVIEAEGNGKISLRSVNRSNKNKKYFFSCKYF